MASQGSGGPILFVNQAGAANAIATLTIPAPATGMFIYVSVIRAARVATAALAGGALLAITSTNLGGWTMRVGNVMAAGGTTAETFPYPEAIKAAVSATAVTIVGPAAGAAVSWDLQAWYYVGT